jgi:hypothetical protein
MKKVAQVVLLSMVVVPMAFLSGCAKRCVEAEPCQKLEQIKREYGGK